MDYTVREWPEIGKIYHYYEDGHIEIIPMHAEKEQMDKELIALNNSIIAVFIGYKLDNSLPFDQNKYYRRKNHVELISRLPFHKDWNLLSEAIIKIEKLGLWVESKRNIITVYGALEISETEYRSYNWYGGTTEDSKIISTWYAVAEFIKWYNENGK